MGTDIKICRIDKQEAGKLLINSAKKVLNK